MPSLNFAETNRLRIRGFLESDTDKIVQLLNDPRVNRGNPAYIVPGNEPALKKTVQEMVRHGILFGVLETKEPLEDGSSWVGFTMLSRSYAPKNRCASFGINLDAKFWGKGYGTHSQFHS
jgi:RimJ/RimL family protein N-acetyltransferase